MTRSTTGVLKQGTVEATMPNEDVIRLLQPAIAALVLAASEIEATYGQSNPLWIKAVDLLDECTDELRQLEADCRNGNTAKD